MIGISPHEMGILFSDIYPGSISDSAISENYGGIEFVEEQHEIMSDTVFYIRELCAIKGITLNRPQHKNSEQLQEKDVALNFDIACTQIHVERFISRVRDWQILNMVCALSMIDLLSSKLPQEGKICLSYRMFHKSGIIKN